MKRKVIKQGNGTLTITLPKQWTKEVGITGEDEVDVELADNSLIIHTCIKKVNMPLSLNLKDMSIEHSRAYISNAYKLGFNEIHVVFNNPSDLVEIQEIVDKLIGFEIISNTKGSCVIKSIAVLNKDEFHPMLKKAHQLNLVTFELLKDDLLKGEYPNLKTILQYNSKVLSFTDLCRRLINKYGVFNEKTDKSFYLLLLEINYINTIMRDIYKYLCVNKGKLNKNVYEFFLKSENMYRIMFDGFFNETLSDVDKSMVLKKKLYNVEASKLFEKSSGKDSVIIARICEIIKNVYASSGPIIAILYHKNPKMGL